MISRTQYAITTNRLEVLEQEGKASMRKKRGGMIEIWIYTGEIIDEAYQEFRTAQQELEGEWITMPKQLGHLQDVAVPSFKVDKQKLGIW